MWTAGRIGGGSRAVMVVRLGTVGAVAVAWGTVVLAFFMEVKEGRPAGVVAVKRRSILNMASL